METLMFEIITKIKNTLKLLENETSQELLKNLKIKLTENVITIKVVVGNLNKEKDKIKLED